MNQEPQPSDRLDRVHSNSPFESPIRLAELERLQFSCDLHDGLLQYLMGAKLHVDALRRKVPQEDPASLNVALIQIESMLRSAVTESRQWIGQLRGESDLESHSMVAILGKLAADFRLRWPATTLSVDIDPDSTKTDFSPDTRTALFRILQEALRNAAQHGQSRSIHLATSVDETNLNWIAEIIDDGKGFDPQVLPEGHYGVEGMRLRAKLIQAELQIDSAPGKGTRVKLSIGQPPPTKS